MKRLLAEAKNSPFTKGSRKPRRALIAFIVLNFLAGTLNAWGYPIFFRCNSDGSLSETLTAPELEVVTHRELTAGAQVSQMKSRCAGLTDCYGQFDQIVSLAEQAGELNAEILSAKKRISDIRATGPASLTLAQALVKLNQSIYACRKDIENLDPLSVYRSQNDKKIFAYYPYDTPYQSVMCYRPDKSRPTSLNADLVKQEIEESLIMGVDPYVTLAIHVMEKGNIENKSDLYLDPIAELASLGCVGESRSDPRGANINSYSSYYRVPFPQLIRNEKLSEKVEQFVARKSNQVQRGKPSYFCVTPEDSEDTESTSAMHNTVTAQPNPKGCCLKVGFRVEQFQARYIAEAMRYVFLHAKVEGGAASNPAERFQTFNGIKKLTGSGEHVSAWRNGVNHFRNPEYGYQAVDYLLNSFLINPAVRKMVEDAQNRYGHKAKSILCRDRKPGLFEVESNAYFVKHRDSPRLETLVPKLVARGYRTEALNVGEKQVLEDELRSLSEEDNLEVNQYVSLSLSEVSPKTLRHYVEKIYPLRRTIGLAAIDSHLGTWQRLTKAQIEAQARQCNADGSLDDWQNGGSPFKSKLKPSDFGDSSGPKSAGAAGATGTSSPSTPMPTTSP